MSSPPYLTVAQRVEYLYSNNFFDDGTITQVHIKRLAAMNFHYFLGYARNYRALVGRRQIRVSRKTPDDVFTVIDLDTKVAALVHEVLRIVEWRLRALVVEHYCAKFEPANSFLQPGQYRSLSNDGSDRDRMVGAILAAILRHDEPYVADHIDQAARWQGLSRPRRYDQANHNQCVQLAADLPLWSVIDSFSFSLLNSFVMRCDLDTTTPVWKQVAGSVKVAAQVFETNLKSVTFVRNAVAHHARLWMRPTSDSPKKPRMFDKLLRDAHPKSMYWAFLNLATFLPDAARWAFVRDLTQLTDQHEIYRHGITRVHEVGEMLVRPVSRPSVVKEAADDRAEYADFINR